MEKLERPRRADARRNRARVIASARKLFARLGNDAQMEEIAADSGLGMGTLYRHFPNKQALLTEIVRERFEGMIELAQAAERIEDPGEAFEAFVVVLSSFQARHRALAEQMANEIEPPPPRMDARQRLRVAISELVARAQAAGTVRADIGPADVALMLSGVAHATALAGDLRPVLTDRYLRIILDGLRPHGASLLPGEPLDFDALQRLKESAPR